MRPIDGDEALRKVERIPFIANENKAFHEGCRYMQKKALRIFHEAKTIGAEPVKHGRWLWDDECECWCCSSCETAVLDNYRGNPTYINYCPNCGAKMDMEVTE